MLYGTICKSLVGATLGTWAGARMREQRSEIRRTGSCALLTGITLGAGLMYLWDFDNGRRRRAAAKDKLASLARRSGSAVAGAARDARNRAQGLTHKIANRISHDEATGTLLAERIRARMGRLVSNPSAIDVSVFDGRVVLEGSVLASEADALLREVTRARGVAHVDDRLTRLDSGQLASDAPADEPKGNGGNGHASSTDRAWEGT